MMIEDASCTARKPNIGANHLASQFNFLGILNNYQRN